jgi:peptidoglycan/xylan/chitin deacetylase (PgdA/CDA1 family)
MSTNRTPGIRYRRTPMARVSDIVSDQVTVERLAKDFRWPGGRKVAVVFNVAYEAWSDGVAPGLGPMGNPLPVGTFDTNALSWGTYGQTRGIERLLRVLDRGRIIASVMTSGILAGRSPKIVKAIADAGHEIVAHAYAQDIVPAKLPFSEVKADITKTTDALAAVVGKRPSGWISPRGTPSAEGVGFLLDAGYLWHGDVFDDDRPYLQFLDGRRIVAIPLTMEINDLPHAMRFGRSPRQFIETFDDFLARGLDGEDEAIMIDVTAHAHVYGRPAGAWAFEEIGRRVRDRDDLWIATRQEIANHVLAVAG